MFGYKYVTLLGVNYALKAKTYPDVDTDFGLTRRQGGTVNGHLLLFSGHCPGSLTFYTRWD